VGDLDGGGGEEKGGRTFPEANWEGRLQHKSTQNQAEKGQKGEIGEENRKNGRGIGGWVSR